MEHFFHFQIHSQLRRYWRLIPRYWKKVLYTVFNKIALELKKEPINVYLNFIFIKKYGNHLSSL